MSKTDTITSTSTSTKKYFSRRWLITLWCCFIITAIVVLGFIFKNDDYVGLAMTLSAVPVAFTSLETVNKWKQAQTKEEDKE